jgi:hypothetical protein
VSVYEAAAHGTVQILAPLLRQFLARGKTIDSTGGRNRTTMLHEVGLLLTLFVFINLCRLFYRNNIHL